MKITTVTVSYGQTQSMPEYSNIKPQLTLTAELEPGDDLAAVQAALWTEARSTVRELIDQALEGEGRPAKYSTDPRYRVVKCSPDRYAAHLPNHVAIFPNDEPLAQTGPFTSPSSVYSSRNLRLAHAQRIAADAAASYGATLFDCSDGDISKVQEALLQAEPEPEPEPEAKPAADDKQRPRRVI